MTGESACALPENFDAEITARSPAKTPLAKVWPLMGYAPQAEAERAGVISNGRTNLTAAELEGERELSRLIESGELASTTPKLNESLTDEDDNPKPADAPKPDDTPGSSAGKTRRCACRRAETGRCRTGAKPGQRIRTPPPSVGATCRRAASPADSNATAHRAGRCAKQLATKYSEINLALDELADKLDNGEVDQGQYDKQSRALSKSARRTGTSVQRQHRQAERHHGRRAGGQRKDSVARSGKDPLTITVNTFPVAAGQRYLQGRHRRPRAWKPCSRH